MKLFFCILCSEADVVVAFTPKGGCPLKQEVGFGVVEIGLEVAFTPKGGCPLKPLR